MKLVLSRALGVFACVALADVAHAQTAPKPVVPPEAPSITTSPVPQTQPGQAPKVLPEMVPSEGAPSASEQQGEVQIIGVEFDGATRYTADQLQARFAPLVNTRVPFAKLIDAVQQIETDYHNSGFFLTRVRGAIERSAAGPVLKVHVLEGYIVGVKLSGDIGPAGNLVYAYLKHLENVRPINAQTLERYILLAKNIPGITLTPLLKPATDEAGAVELVAKVERKTFDASVSDDNRSSKFAGPNEILVSVAGNAFTSLGDQTTLILFNTPVDKEELFGQLSEEFFLGSEGLKLSSSFGYGVLEPGDTLAAAQYKSRLLLIDAGAEYPIIRTRALSLYATGNFDISNAIIDQSDFTPNVDHRASKDDLSIFRFGLRAATQDSFLGSSFQGANTAEIKYHRSTSDLFGATKDGPVRQARANEQHDFTKVTAKAKRTQDLYSWSMTSLAVEFAAAGQWSRDILPPSEKFFLGGTEFGRGFYNGEITGDRAVTGTIELQLNDGFSVPVLGAQRAVGMQYYSYYDIGQAWGTRASGDLSEHIESLGIGVTAELTEHVSLQVEGVERFTRRPTGVQTTPLPEHAIYFRIAGQY